MSRRRKNHHNHNSQNDRNEQMRSESVVSDEMPVSDFCNSSDHENTMNGNEDFDAVGRVLKELEEKMDQSYMDHGKMIAGLFRTLCNAALKLPKMKLCLEWMDVDNDENHLTVTFHRSVLDEADDYSDTPGDHDDCYNSSDDEDSDSIGNYDEDDDEDIEEGRIYDAD